LAWLILKRYNRLGAGSSQIPLTGPSGQLAWPHFAAATPHPTWTGG